MNARAVHAFMLHHVWMRSIGTHAPVHLAIQEYIVRQVGQWVHLYLCVLVGEGQTRVHWETGRSVGACLLCVWVSWSIVWTCKSTGI